MKKVLIKTSFLMTFYSRTVIKNRGKHRTGKSQVLSILFIRYRDMLNVYSRLYKKRITCDFIRLEAYYVS